MIYSVHSFHIILIPRIRYPYPYSYSLFTIDTIVDRLSTSEKLPLSKEEIWKFIQDLGFQFTELYFPFIHKPYQTIPFTQYQRQFQLIRYVPIHPSHYLLSIIYYLLSIIYYLLSIIPRYIRLLIYLP